MKIFLKIILLFGFMCLIQSYLKAQPTITWQKTYGEDNIDYGYSIVQTPDEGYIAVGRKRIIATNYIFAMRLNKFGDTIWTRTFTGYQANEIEKTSDGNYIICGYNLIKININGETLWTHPESFGAKLKETSDKGFILCLSANNGPFLSYPKLRKVDSLGNIQWERIYTDSISTGGFSDFTINSYGEYVMTGNYDDFSFNHDRLFIMKTDSIGNIIWFRKYGTYLYSESIIVVNDSNYIIGGADSFTGRGAFLSKFNTFGNLVWFIDYSDGRTRFSLCSSVINTLEGGLAFTGTYDIGNFDFYVRLDKTDSKGSKIWRNLYGFGNSDEGMNIRQTTDSGFIIIGYRENYHLGDIYIIKTDKTGYANPPVSISNNSEILPSDFELYQNYPNPFNPSTTISYELPHDGLVKLKIYDITGKEILTLVNELKHAGRYEVTFNGSNLASGIFFYKIESGKFVETKKMILIK